jgi:probable F420-dependent oxidoreductase
MDLNRLGVWSTELRSPDAGLVRETVAELATLGYRTLWIPGMRDGLEVLEDTATLLSGAEEIIVAVGVLGIWGQPASALAERVERLDDDFGPRTIVGLGISSPEMATARGMDFGRPLADMARYLDAVEAASPPVPRERLLLGALGPRMSRLAADRTAGLHPFLVTPEYSSIVREDLGPEPLIAPHLAVVLGDDSGRVRALAREKVGFFFGARAYKANLRRLGFSDEDFSGGGSNRLIDAVIAHGGLDDIAQRIREHFAAGADHLALHVLHEGDSVPLQEWRELSQLLSG